MSRSTIDVVRASIPLLLLALTACEPVNDPASPRAMDALRDRAAFDLKCPAEQLRWVSLGDRTRGVTGCSRQATYLWDCRPTAQAVGPRVDRCEWVMNNAANLESH